MKSLNSIDFPTAVQRFLTSYLPSQRGCSRNTVLSYRDSLKLLMKYVVDEKGFDLKKFSFTDLTKDLVNEFLEHYQDEGASPAAANQRLGAIKSFVRYIGTESIETTPELKAIQDIKMNRSPGHAIEYLTPEQISKLINQPDPSKRNGLRHKAILMLLYESGCRVQELCDLTVGDVFLTDDQATVNLHGKGAKIRPVFITGPAVEVLKTYRDKFQKRSVKTDPFFVNRLRMEMERDGITYVVQKYASQVAKSDPTFPRKVNCQMLRHSKAMHMLQAGIDIDKLREFLGHENLSTTMAYAKAVPRTPEEIIGNIPQLTEAKPLPDLTNPDNLMDFLNSLK